MTKPNDEIRKIRHSGFVIRHSFGFLVSSFDFEMTIKVKVKLFAIVRDAAARSEVALDLRTTPPSPPPPRSWRRNSPPRPHLPRCAFALNLE